MNTKETQRIVNDNMREFKSKSQIWQQNVIRINTGNTLEHELKKAEIAYKLIQQGRRIVCEASIFDDKCRPDILVIDIYPPIAYEILKSETEEMLNEKRARYLPIKIVPIFVE